VTVLTSTRRLRTDAVRNMERIVDAAHRVFTRLGSAGAMEDVAAEAGVGVATVYRRFPTKELLLRAVLDRSFEAFLGVTSQAQETADPIEAMRIALCGAARFLTDDPNTIAAATTAGLWTMDMAQRFFEPVATVLRRGQEASVFRADLLADDVPRIVLMLVGTLPSFDPDSEGWRRYVDLLLDMLTARCTELSTVTPVHDHSPPLPRQAPPPATPEK
jgi:AcrR family transcriptional regulator